MPPEIELIDDDIDNDVAVVEEAPPEEKVDRGDVVEAVEPVETKKEPDEELPEAPVKETRIPKARFDEVNTRRQDAERELLDAQAEIARLKAISAVPAAAPIAATTEIKDLRKLYHTALMEGDTEQAETLSEQIDNKVIQIAEQHVEQRQAARANASSLQVESSKALADYPYLDTPEGEEALNAILAARDRRMASGMEPGQALRESVAAIAPKFAPEGEDAPHKGLQEGERKTDTRPANAVARGARDSTVQPPQLLAGQGNRTTEAKSQDPTKMTEEQFAQLTVAEKRKLRGDA